MPDVEPDAHAEHVAAPPVLNVPAPQSSQPLKPLLESFPPAQAEHRTDPGPEKYPASQGTHASSPPLSAYSPAWHDVQLVDSVTPEYVPGTQSAQLA